MSAVYLTGVGPDFLSNVRAVRAALYELSPDGERPSASEARRAIEEGEADGYVLLGESIDRDHAERVVAALAERGCKAVIDPDLNRLERRLNRAAKLTPEQVFSGTPRIPPAEPSAAAPEAPPSPAHVRVAYAALAFAGGDPLRACAHLHAFKRATGSGDPYERAMASLIEQFPWIGPEVAKLS
jgi:hypothetical protein